MYADRIEFLVDDYLDLMKATPRPQRGIQDLLAGRWWRKGGVAALVCGLVIGLGGYLAVATPGSPPPQAPRAPAVVEVPPQEVSRPAPQETEIPVWRKNFFKRNRKYKRLLTRGWRHYRRGSYRKASSAFNRAIRMNPRRTQAYYGLAVSLFEQGYEARALRVLRRGAKRAGPKSNLWVLEGVIHQWRGEERSARKLYRRYLKMAPRGTYARDVRVMLARERLSAPVSPK
jgi:tetratricopeptide (TPR) repeat protein